MLLKIFRGTGPGVILLIFLTAGAVWAGAFIEPRLPSSFHFDADPMPLYLLLKSLIGQNAIAGTMVSFLLVLLISFLLVNFNTTVFFINERTFLPAILFILFSGFFPHYQVLNPVLPAALLLMIAIMRIMDAYRKNETAYNFFDAALLVSTGSLFYASLIWYGILIIIGIAILRTGSIKEIVLSVLGFCTPLLITAGIYYATGRDLVALGGTVLANLFGDAGHYYFSRMMITGSAITGLCAVVSIFYLFRVVKSKKIKSRKTFTLLSWGFLITVIMYISTRAVSVEIIFPGAIPLSYYLSHYFLFSRSRILPEIFFSAIFLTVITIQIIFLS